MIISLYDPTTNLVPACGEGPENSERKCIEGAYPVGLQEPQILLTSKYPSTVQPTS